MNINVNVTKNVKEAGKAITAGIHNATFKGIDKSTIEGKDGKSYDVMSLILDVEDFGEFRHNFFEPTSNERKEMAWGVTASQVDHFVVAIRQIIDALDPKIGQGIDDGSITLSGSFANIVKTLKSLTAEYIGEKVQIKVLPGKNNFNSIPSYPARISKNGNLSIATRFIGKELTLLSNELKKIEDAKNATPTNMINLANKETDDLLKSMSIALNDKEDDDLPF